MAINITKPKNKKSLGVPPSREKPKISNLTKESSDKDVILNFKVSFEFKKEFKRYALEKDKTMVDILKESFKLYKKNNI